MTEVNGNRQATVRINDLLLRAYIGIKEEEINNKQDVLINIRLTYDATAAINEKRSRPPSTTAPSPSRSSSMWTATALPSSSASHTRC